MTAKLRHRVFLVGVGLKSESLTEIKDRLAELTELAESADAEVVGAAVQAVESWNPATLIGSGKVAEVAGLVQETRAQTVIVDHQLSGVQGRNLESEIKVPVIDRTQLILEIFGSRAQTHEGKLQVDLAQLLDLSSRQVGAWHGSLSRQGGGIGTRGPGERAIELDRRVIRDKIIQIRKELENVRQHRAQHRATRRRNKVPSFALIGYTNAGKSTLLNQLTHAEVLAEDKMFATLDPTTRRVYIPEAPPAVLTDTVGFIRHLPTKLIEAFKATLEESAEADALLIVVDVSHAQWSTHLKVVEEMIQEFGWSQKPLLYVFNKIDEARADVRFKADRTPRIFVSGKTGEGLDGMRCEMAKILSGLYSEVQLFFANSEKHLLYELGRDTRITKQEEGTQGVICYANMTPVLLGKWNQYLVANRPQGSQTN